MSSNVSYHRCRCESTAECLREIADHLELEWELTEVRGPRGGPFYLVFRKDDRDA